MVTNRWYYFLLFFFHSFLACVDYSFDNIDTNQLREIWRQKQHDYYSISINGEFFPGTRPWHIRWEKIKSSTNFEGKKVLDIGTSVGLCPIFVSLFLSPAKVVAFDNQSDAVATTEKLKKLFCADFELYQIDLDQDPYEEMLGNDYDIIFCMSVYNWVGKKQRLLNYLGRFNELIFEGHDAVHSEMARLRSVGFKHFKILGDVDRGRQLIYCSK